jgi:hypothetical protein
MEHRPDTALLQDTLKSKVEKLSYVNQGGFKAVYKGYVHRKGLKQSKSYIFRAILMKKTVLN